MCCLQERYYSPQQLDVDLAVIAGAGLAVVELAVATLTRKFIRLSRPMNRSRLTRSRLTRSRLTRSRKLTASHLIQRPLRNRILLRRILLLHIRHQPEDLEFVVSRLFQVRELASFALDRYATGDLPALLTQTFGVNQGALAGCALGLIRKSLA